MLRLLGVSYQLIGVKCEPQEHSRTSVIAGWSRFEAERCSKLLSTQIKGTSTTGSTPAPLHIALRHNHNTGFQYQYSSIRNNPYAVCGMRYSLYAYILDPGDPGGMMRSAL